MGEKTLFVFPPDEAADQPLKVTWPCTVSVPLDGGGRQEQMVDVRFNVLDQEQTVAAYKKGDVSLFDAVVDSFPTLKKQGGGDADADQARTLFRKRPFAVKGILDGYFEMLGNRLPKN